MLFPCDRVEKLLFFQRFGTVVVIREEQMIKLELKASSESITKAGHYQVRVQLLRGTVESQPNRPRQAPRGQRTPSQRMTGNGFADYPTVGHTRFGCRDWPKQS